ncbi:MAG TPA: hypothetical protein VGG40_11860 [Solirubrobacterales bacterium]|jgi:hypothetical protein
MSTLRLGIGGLLREAVELRQEGDLASVLAEALRHYAERLRSSGRPLDPPNFVGAGGPVGRTFVEVPVEDRVAEILASDWKRLAIPQDLLATHAAFVYLADSDRRCDERGPEPLSIAP